MMIICFSSFNLLMWRNTLIDLWIVNRSCIPEANPTLITVYDNFSMWIMLMVKNLPANAEYIRDMGPSIYYWIQFANILLKVLHLFSSVILTCDMYECIVFIWLSDFGVRIEVLELNLLLIVYRIHLWRHLFLNFCLYLFCLFDLFSCSRLILL